MGLTSTLIRRATAVSGSASDVVSWGLSHRGNETTPNVSSVGAKLLEEYGGMYVGDTSKKQVYFTFDLGYEAGYTAEVLDILQAGTGILIVCFKCTAIFLQMKILSLFGKVLT